MIAFLEIALSNIAMAAVLAIPATLATLWGRRPALAYGLWLLVLVKLVTPPLVHIPVPWPHAWTLDPAAAAEAPAPPMPQAPMAVVDDVVPPVPAPVAELPAVPVDNAVPGAEPVRVEGPPADPVQQARLPEAAPAQPQPPPEKSDPTSETTTTWTAWLALPWLAGSAGWLVLAAHRLRRFRRMLQFARPAPPDLQAECRALADAMHVRCPTVELLPGAVSPMLWAIGWYPRLLLPEGLLERLRPEQRGTLLAHELAHWRRGDHRVRCFEMLVLALYWWCPLAWWALAQLHQAEEECCDAWVLDVLPKSGHAYALALVETIDFLAGARATLPPVASGVGHVRLLKRRLTMILRGSTPRSLTRTGLLAVAGFGLLLLPFVPSRAQVPADKETNEIALSEPQGPPDNDEARLRELRADAFLQDLLAAGGSQQDLEAERKALERKLKDLQRAIDKLKAQADKPGDEKPKAGELPGQKKPGLGSPMGGTGTTSSAKAGSIEKRLEQVERKLDALLWEVMNLRRGMAKPHPGGSGTMIIPGLTPGKGATPAPQGGDLGPQGPGSLLKGGGSATASFNCVAGIGGGLDAGNRCPDTAPLPAAGFGGTSVPSGAWQTVEPPIGASAPPSSSSAPPGIECFLARSRHVVIAWRHVAKTKKDDVTEDRGGQGEPEIRVVILPLRVVVIRWL